MRSWPVLLALAALAPTRAAGAEENRSSTRHVRVEKSIQDVVPEVVFYGGFYSGAFRSVAGIFCDRRNGEMFVTDPASNAIEVFDEKGSPLFAFSDEEHLKEPTRLVVDHQDRLLVIDAERWHIKVFNYRGEFEGFLELPGLDPGKRPSITALAIDDNGDLWVGESASGQVIAFDKQYRPKLRIGSYGHGEGQFDGIIGIALGERNVYVASQEGLAVQVFTRQGRFLRAWGRHDAGLHNVSLPAGIAVDAKGRIVLLDTLRQELKYFDPMGNLIGLYGGFGKDAGNLAYATDLSMDRQGRLCVADGGNRRVQVMRPIDAPFAR